MNAAGSCTPGDDTPENACSAGHLEGQSDTKPPASSTSASVRRVELVLTREQWMRLSWIVADGIRSVRGSQPYWMSEVGKQFAALWQDRPVGTSLLTVERLTLALAARREEHCAPGCPHLSAPSELSYDLTTADAAKILGCSPRSVQRYIERGTLSARRGPDGAFLLNRSEVDLLPIRRSA